MKCLLISEHLQCAPSSVLCQLTSNAVSDLALSPKFFLLIEVPCPLVIKIKNSNYHHQLYVASNIINLVAVEGRKVVAGGSRGQG